MPARTMLHQGVLTKREAHEIYSTLKNGLSSWAPLPGIYEMTCNLISPCSKPLKGLWSLSKAKEQRRVSNQSRLAVDDPIGQLLKNFTIPLVSLVLASLLFITTGCGKLQARDQLNKGMQAYKN